MFAKIFPEWKCIMKRENKCTNFLIIQCKQRNAISRRIIIVCN